MNEEKRLKFATAWLRAEGEDAEDDQWAIIDLQELVADDPDEAWEVLQVIIEHAASDWHLTMIGSAPLEDLMDDYGDTYFDILERAQTNRIKWANALRHVWIGNQEKRERIRALIARFETPNES